LPFHPQSLFSKITRLTVDKTSNPLRSLAITALVLGLFGLGVAGCGGDAGSSSDSQDVSRTMNMVTVNWIEGLAMTYMQEAILEDSLGMEVKVNEVQGGGIAFSSVASGDADVFNEAWLPTTHKKVWGESKDQLQKLGYTYRGTSAGVTVPAYMEIDRITEIPKVRGAVNGKINGIESGAVYNDLTREILKNNDIEGFEVVAASGPATWQALSSAIEDKEPIIVTGWKPHWKWDRFDLKYLEGAQTNQTPVLGGPEDIFTIVDNEFIGEFPKKAVCFLQEFEANDRQVGSLMFAFKNRGDESRSEAVRGWIQNHPEDVGQWMDQARECAASDGAVEPLPDDAIHSRPQNGENA
jgi:glycine betaine/proline transport system substrate-binding protein